MTESHSHDSEGLAAAIDRLGDDVEDPFDEHAKSRGRFGWYDLAAFHAVTNVFVSYCREQPRGAGHVWFAQSLVTLIVLLVAVIWALSR